LELHLSAQNDPADQRVLYISTAHRNFARLADQT